MKSGTIKKTNKKSAVKYTPSNNRLLFVAGILTLLLGFGSFFLYQKQNSNQIDANAAFYPPVWESSNSLYKLRACYINSTTFKVIPENAFGGNAWDAYIKLYGRTYTLRPGTSRQFTLPTNTTVNVSYSYSAKDSRNFTVTPNTVKTKC